VDSVDLDQAQHLVILATAKVLLNLNWNFWIYYTNRQINKETEQYKSYPLSQYVHVE